MTRERWISATGCREAVYQVVDTASPDYGMAMCPACKRRHLFRREIEPSPPPPPSTPDVNSQEAAASVEGMTAARKRAGVFALLQARGPMAEWLFGGGDGSMRTLDECFWAKVRKGPGCWERRGDRHVEAAAEARGRAAAEAEIARLREALRNANGIITDTRRHLSEEHRDCPWAVLGVLRDGERASLAAEPEPAP